MKRLKYQFIMNMILCSVFMISCSEDYDGIELKPYQFSENNIVIGNEASQLLITIKNVDKAGKRWSILSATVTDEVYQDSVFENDWIIDPSSEHSNQILSPIFQKAWFDIRRINEGQTLSIGVTRNAGAERKLSVAITDGLGGGCGTFNLTQKAGK